MPNTDKKILLIEDEQSLSNVVELNLKLEGFNVVCISNGRTAIDHAHTVGEYDLVILDVMLPEVSGWDICSMYKSVADTPILFVSAKGTSSDKIKGLRLGADDFLAKPFDLEELLLRVQVLILRHQGKNPKTQQTDSETFEIGDFKVNLLTFEVKKGEKTITELSKREIDLLHLFVNHEGEVLSRDFILDQLWGKDTYPTTRTIDNYILSFRKLFEVDAKHPELFHSIRGVGYKFVGS